MSKVEIKIITDEDEEGRRLDNYLIGHLNKVPRELIYRIIRKGEVRVNRGRKKQSYRLQIGDAVRIPPLHSAENAPVKVNDDTRDLIESSIIFEDDRLICVNKPTGLAVHGGSSLNYGLIEAIRVIRQNRKFELAHRIDRDTSGCLVVAKDGRALRAIQEEFKSRAVVKVYDFFAVGLWNTRNKSVHKKLMRYKTAWGERRVKIDATGQTARTDFRVIEKAQNATRMEAILHTGRTHQIRVHAAACGNPIVGDRKYGNHDGSSPRLCLHATRLSFVIDEHKYKFEAPQGEDLGIIWAKIAHGDRLD